MLCSSWKEEPNTYQPPAPPRAVGVSAAARGHARDTTSNSTHRLHSQHSHVHHSLGADDHQQRQPDGVAGCPFIKARPHHGWGSGLQVCHMQRSHAEDRCDHRGSSLMVTMTSSASVAAVAAVASNWIDSQAGRADAHHELVEHQVVWDQLLAVGLKVGSCKQAQQRSGHALPQGPGAPCGPRCQQGQRPSPGRTAPADGFSLLRSQQCVISHRPLKDESTCIKHA